MSRSDALPAVVVLLATLLLFGLASIGAAQPARAEDETAAVPVSPEIVASIKKGLSARDADQRLTAARAALDVQDASLFSALCKCLKDDEAAVRGAAIDALVRRTDPSLRKRAAPHIAALLEPVPREAVDQEDPEQAHVIRALHDLAQVSTIKRLLDIHPLAPKADGLRERLMAVANVPSADAIEALIQFGSRGRRGAGRGALVSQALHYATGIKIDRKPEAWRVWWREAKRDFDFEAAARARQEARDAVAEKAREREEAAARKEERRREKRERRERGDDPEPDEDVTPGEP